MDDLAIHIESVVKELGRLLFVSRMGSMFSIYFSENMPRSFEDVKATQHDQFPALFHTLIDHGVYLPPSAFETSFLSVAHDSDVLERTAKAFTRALAV